MGRARVDQGGGEAAVIQALLHLGADGVDSMIVARLRNRLAHKQRTQFLHDACRATDWIADVARAVAA